MQRIDIIPTWSFRDEAGHQLDPKLFGLLAAIHEQGKLTKATLQVGISYRHGWNLLKKWTAFFGCELVSLQKGKGATLTPLGEKLLWTEQRVVARFEPQLKNLASELNLEIQKSLESSRPQLRLYASHGYAVAQLPDHAVDYQLDLQYKSAEQALAALERGQCDLAGFHVPTEVISASMLETYHRYLKPRAHRVISFVTRCQGLMIKPANPKAIVSLQDLVRSDVRFINRQTASGTRALLDELMRREGLSSTAINGFEDEEYTHSAVAAYVAAGMADVGFGVEAAARQFGLGFLPITSEYYLFVCHTRTLKQAAMRRFIASLTTPGFVEGIAQLPGYAPSHAGEIMRVEDFLACRT
ncbi:MAG: substrate-binding domain-containing protein [Motiliproteus sp.]